jgi:hypothetical protein
MQIVGKRRSAPTTPNAPREVKPPSNYANHVCHAKRAAYVARSLAQIQPRAIRVVLQLARSSAQGLARSSR